MKTNIHWKGYVVKHNYVNFMYLMTVLDNYMFQPTGHLQVVFQRT